MNKRTIKPTIIRELEYQRTSHDVKINALYTDEQTFLRDHTAEIVLLNVMILQLNRRLDNLETILRAYEDQCGTFTPDDEALFLLYVSSHDGHDGHDHDR